MNDEKIRREMDARFDEHTARYRKRLEAERSERKRERRERIATAALTGILTNFMPGTGWQQSAALRAVSAADALIAELDKQP